MKLSNKTLHELGMIDDPTADDSTFAKMAEEYAVGRKRKYKNTRKYSADKSAQYRSRRLAKKAREEQIARESEAIDALYYQQSYNKRYDNGEIVS